MKRLAWLALLLAVPSTVAAQPPPLRVRLFWTRPPAAIEIAPAGSPLRIRPCATCPWVERTDSIRLQANGEKLKVSGLPASEAMDVDGIYRVAAAGVPAFLLSAPLHIQAKDGRLQIVAEIPIEDYTARVLAGESSTFAANESLKVMAVAIRTFAARNRGRHAAEGFDLCDTTHCQDLRLSAVPERLASAAQETEGELLWYEGRPAATFYHRECGGQTESAHEAWPGERFTYLRAQPDPHCKAAGGTRWRAEITKADLGAALAREGIRVPQPVESVTVRHRTASGRASDLLFVGSGSLPVRASTVRLAVGRQLGWTLIRSDLYEIHDRGGSVVFQGRGAGHGVGLCQTGAARMGEAGQTYREILAFYFPGTRLGVAAQDLPWRALASPQIELLTTQPREDGFLLEMAERLLREAEARVGAEVRFRPQLRVYPDVEVYRNATGQPGWMAASTRGRVIRMQPAETLRRRGTLEETLRHEMYHVVVESLSRRALPLWFREGLVLALSGGAPGTAASSSMTLAEIERVLAAPNDRTEFERAYAAAQARVALLIEQHGLPAVMRWMVEGLPEEATR